MAPKDVEERGKGGGLRVFDAAVVVLVGVLGLFLAFAALDFIAGFLWGIVKLAIVVALIGGVLWLLVRRRR